MSGLIIAWTTKKILKDAVMSRPLGVFAFVMARRVEVNRVHAGRIRSLVGRIHETLTGVGAIALGRSLGHVLHLQ